MVYTWEHGRRSPPASMLFRVAERVGIDVRHAITTFYRTPPGWLDDLDLTSAALIAQLLRDQQGNTPIVQVADQLGVNRFTVSRWLSGHTEPRLPDFLAVLDVTSLRLVDFVATLVDPAELPSLEAVWARREAQRTLAIAEPWAAAVLRAVEIGLDTPDALVEGLGLSDTLVQRCLERLKTAGQVVRRRGHWHPVEVTALDTRRSPDTARALKSFWADVGTQRLKAGAEGAWAYNVFAVSQDQLQRIQALQTAYFQSLRALIAEPEPADTVALVNLQVVTLAHLKDA